MLLHCLLWWSHPHRPPPSVSSWECGHLAFGHTLCRSLDLVSRCHHRLRALLWPCPACVAGSTVVCTLTWVECSFLLQSILHNALTCFPCGLVDSFTSSKAFSSQDIEFMLLHKHVASMGPRNTDWYVLTGVVLFVLSFVSTACTLFCVPCFFDKHALAKWPVLRQEWHLAFQAGHCSQGCDFQPQFLQCSLLGLLGLLSLCLPTACTSQGFVMCCNCFSADSSALARSMALWRVRVFLSLKHSFLA